MIQVSGKDLIRVLERAGWVRMPSGGGSHVKLRRLNGNGRVIVPVPGSRPLPPGTLKGDLAQAGLSERELEGLL